MKRRLFLTGLVLATTVACAAQSHARGDDGSAKATASDATTAASSGKLTTMADGLQIEDLTVGTGERPTRGRTVSVHYVGTLMNGTKFDSSRDRGSPFDFAIGEGQVIKGWDEGVGTMRVGGLRKLVIPPDLAYGSRAVGPIPANSTLVFEVELLAVH